MERFPDGPSRFRQQHRQPTGFDHEIQAANAADPEDRQGRCRIATPCLHETIPHHRCPLTTRPWNQWNNTMTTSRLSLCIILLLIAGIPGASLAESASVDTDHKTATFAGGCFWCMEPPFDKLEGVISTTSGYIGGHKQDPSYKEVSRGGTGHAEAVQIVYDPGLVDYAELLDVFWHNIDPTTANGQFCDWGDQYRSEIFYHDTEQRQLATKSRAALEELKPFEEPVVTAISEATTFYPAEDYHQDYYQKNPVRYKFYRYGCGRDKRLEELWGQGD
jgi:peptide-methionine (S)-S-oxide reductase